MRRLYALILCVLAAFQLMSQDVEPIEFRNFRYQVKQIEEFMSRFNGELSVMDTTGSMDSFHEILFLFDEDLYYKKREEVDSFINKCMANSIKLRYEDSNWRAKARCSVKFKGKKDTVLLTLKTEKVKEYIYKWVVVGAEGKIVTLAPQKRNPGLQLSPTDNDLNFMSLTKATTREAVNVLNISDSAYMVDCLTVFYSLVYNGLLQVEYVDRLEYEFYDIEGYDLLVSFDRSDAAHAGWLIKRFKRHEK